MQGMDGMIVPPSNTWVDQAKRRPISTLTRHSSENGSYVPIDRSSLRTEFGRMTSGRRTSPRRARPSGDGRRASRIAGTAADVVRQAVLVVEVAYWSATGSNVAK